MNRLSIQDPSLITWKVNKTCKKTINNIIHEFTSNNSVILSNGEKIQYIGNINSEPCFLFFNDPYLFYLKYIKNIGFTIITNTQDLDKNLENFGHIDKLPNLRKILVTQSLIDKPDNLNIFIISNKLKIGHINSIYLKYDNNKIENSEYLLVYENTISILCYSHLTGYSIINKKKISKHFDSN